MATSKSASVSTYSCKTNATLCPEVTGENLRILQGRRRLKKQRMQRRIQERRRTSLTNFPRPKSDEMEFGNHITKDEDDDAFGDIYGELGNIWE